MNILKKIYLKIKIEIVFLLEHKYGFIKSRDIYSFPKFKIKNLLPPNPVIIDCGSHLGTDSIQFSKLIPSATIHSFEAAPIIFEKLKKNVRKYKNINCYPLALSNKNGQAEFFISSGDSDGSSSLLEPSEHLETHPTVFFNEKIIVDTITLDDWALKNNITSVDLLWLDMQGFEMQMLQASKNIINTVKVIHAEVSLKETYKGVVPYMKFRFWLESIGFKIVEEALPTGTDMGNVLFCRK